MKLEKLKNASFEELRVRAAQKLSAFGERQGWSRLVKLPSDEDFATLRVSRDGNEPSFFSGLSSPQATAARLKSRWPKTAQLLIEKADRICDGKFDLLGFTALSFGDPIDWHFEPIANKRIPLVHWSQLDYLDSDVAGDKKIIWELNRHQYFMTLGQAYLLTGDERYARVFVKHLDAWMEANPPKLGINWASSLEIAFRSMSWLWAFYFFKNSPSMPQQTYQRALKFLYLNARHLESYLSTYFSPNTHLTGEALGLFYLGTLLPEFKEAGRWQQLGRDILIEQLPVHVRPDGVYFEQSSYYHRYTTDFYIHFMLLARANNVELPKQVEDYVGLLLDHLMCITRPDGTTPLFGDDDGGRLAMLDVRPGNDFRATVAVGAALFNRGDYKFVAGDAAEELLWLMGVDGLDKFDAIDARQPSQTSKAFHDGGYFVMRDGWTTESNYLLFDCGPHGSLACGHAHADALAFDLAANGRTVLVDPGTFTYTGSKQLRDWFRGSGAHNTLTIEKDSSSVPGGAFSWKTKANCSLGQWVSNKRFDFASGQHDGFMRLQSPATVKRSILFLKGDYWIIRDSFSGIHEQGLEIYFHFEPGAEATLDIRCFGPGRMIEEEGWISHCYGQKEPAKTSAYVTIAGPEQAIVSFLLPNTAGIEWNVVEIKDQQRRAFVVDGAKGRDLVIIQPDEQLDWLWLRFAGDELQEVVSPQSDTDVSDPSLSALISDLKKYVRH